MFVLVHQKYGKLSVCSPYNDRQSTLKNMIYEVNIGSSCLTEFHVRYCYNFANDWGLFYFSPVVVVNAMSTPTAIMTHVMVRT